MTNVQYALKLFISSNTVAYTVWPKYIFFNVRNFFEKSKNCIAENCRSGSYFCDRLFKSYIQEKKYLKSNSSNLMQAGLSRMIIPIKLDSSTLKERGMARWGGLKSKSLVGPPRLRKGMHHHYIHWKFDLTCIVRNIISIWTTY